jgi:hypothetical protein
MAGQRLDHPNGYPTLETSMATSIHDRTDREQQLAYELREAAIKEINRRNPDEVRDALGLARSGLDRLLAEKRWDLRVAFRVVDCLQVDVVDHILKSAADS